MLSNSQINNLKSFFQSQPQIKLVYLFGSQARKTPGPLSDFDFAFYLKEKDKKKLFDFKLNLITKLSQLLKSDKIDVAIINLIESPELNYNIIKEGKLIFEKEPYRLLIEPRILNDYFDFHNLLLRYNLTAST